MPSENLTDKNEKLFNVALETRNFEISLFWQRSNYFLVLNSALAAGFFSLKDEGYALVLAGLGSIASLLWILVNLGGKYWHSRWEHELIVREQKLYPEDPKFAASREQTDEYVRRSLQWNGPGVLRQFFDRLVVLKPSVSGVMTILSLVFLLTWIGLLVRRSQVALDFAWMKPGGIMLLNFVLSMMPSLAAIGVLYLLYVASALYAGKRIGKAECWWLPGANTFRLVIRNLPRNAHLSSIRFRAWLREVAPASEGMSVRTFIDSELTQGERLLLPEREDQPLICFRLEPDGEALKLVVTDKLGNPIESRPIDDVRLMVEFSLRTRNWFLFKHDIARAYSIPRYRLLSNGERTDVFREEILPTQGFMEDQIKSLTEYADDVAVTI
jgi:hypothetical protein